MKLHFRYATHAEVLTDHPRFRWIGVADPDGDARAAARDRWRIPTVAADAFDLACAAEVEVAVLATPPDDRGRLLDAFPNLRAVVVEKPLATTLAAAQAFVRVCHERGILVQVNVPRRADRTVRMLAAGGLADRVGPIQAVQVVYGNGLSNHGPHLIDLVRHLAGDVVSVRADPDPRTHRADGPIAGDRNIPFVARTAGALAVAFSPVHFNWYRESEVVIWGERGRLAYRHGGLLVECSRVVDGKAPANTREIEARPSETLEPTLGDALYALYDNLAAALDGTEPLVSPAEDALRAATVIDAVDRSAAGGGREIACGPADDGAR